MKKSLFIIAGLLVVALLSCSSSHNNAGTSLVTIKIGNDKTASLSVEKATLFAKLRNFLAYHLQVRSAEALVPSNVLSITVTAWASDMPTITQTVDVSGSSFVTIIMEVPNGFNRLFAINGFDGLGGVGNITYAGGMSADLNGSDVYLAMPMNNVGSVNNIFYVNTAGSDTTGNGTLQKPFRTITNALSIATSTRGNTGVLVWPGTYDTAGGELYPLLLPQGSALACLGQNYSVMLDDTGTLNPAGAMVSVNGGALAAPAYLSGCNIFSSLAWSAAVDDNGSVLNISNSYVHEPLGVIFCQTAEGISLSGPGSSVTNSKIVANPSCSAGFLEGIVTLAAVSISGNSIIDVANGDAIYISSGNPTITNNTITGNSIGVYINDGGPVIGNNVIRNNSSGGIESFSNSSTVAPTVSNNTISGSYYGIFTYSGTWNISGNKISGNTNYGVELYAQSNIGGTISGNTIISNGTGTLNGIGIDLAIGGTFTYPSINNNSLSCNTMADLNSLATTTVDATGNSWDHLPPQVFTPSLAPCPAGADVCYAGPLPDTSSAKLVASPCP